MPSLTELLYVASIVAGNILAGTAMYFIESIVFAGPLYTLGAVVAAAYCLSVAVSVWSRSHDSTRSSNRFHL